MITYLESLRTYLEHEKEKNNVKQVFKPFSKIITLHAYNRYVHIYYSFCKIPFVVKVFLKKIY